MVFYTQIIIRSHDVGFEVFLPLPTVVGYVMLCIMFTALLEQKDLSEIIRYLQFENFCYHFLTCFSVYIKLSTTLS